MKKTIVIALIGTMCVASFSANARMSKKTKGFLMGALAGSAVTYMVNKNSSNNKSQEEKCHIEEVIKKDEKGNYKTVNVKICE